MFAVVFPFFYVAFWMIDVIVCMGVKCPDTMLVLMPAEAFYYLLMFAVPAIPAGLLSYLSTRG